MLNPQSVTGPLPQDVQRRLEAIVSQAIDKHRNRTSELLAGSGRSDCTDYDAVRRDCVERAVHAFSARRPGLNSDDAVFSVWEQKSESPGDSKITHPVQDLVLCELVMQRNASACDTFRERYAALAATNYGKLRSAGYPMDRLSFDSEGAIDEVLTQAALHDSRHEYRKQEKSGPLANQPGRGAHYGEVDDQMKVVGFALRSYGGQTPLFNWLCTVLRRFFLDMLNAELKKQLTPLGYGTMVGGQHRLELTSGAFSATRHLWASVHVLGAGPTTNSKGVQKATSLKTRLLTIESETLAITEKPAVQTLMTPGEIKLIQYRLGQQQLAESDERGQGSGLQARAKNWEAITQLQGVLYTLLQPGQCLSAKEVNFLKRCASEKQIDIAREYGKPDYWVSREKTRILNKLAPCFIEVVKGQRSEFLQSIVESMSGKKRVEDFWSLIVFAVNANQ